MASLFSLVFSCCWTRRTKEQDIPDDRSRLIPATEPSLDCNPSVVVVDHQRLKQRLGTIVRSKEGQMVNVTSQIPFNLYNKSLPVLDPSSSSRSASASTTRESQSPNAPMRHNRKVRIRSPLQISPHHSAEASPARSCSKSSREKADEMEGVEEPVLPPILNVRLVRGYGVVARRGRALVKAVGGHMDGAFESGGGADRGKGKERADTELQQGPGESPPDGDPEVGSTVNNNGTTSACLGNTHPMSSESLVSERPGPRGEDSDQNALPATSCPPLHLSSMSDVGFRIQDMGAITLSFGD